MGELNICKLQVIVLYDQCNRAVANGPVGPAMAGPIIEPVFFSKKCLVNLSGLTNKRASHRDVRIVFNTESP